MPSRLLTGVLAFAISALPASSLAADDLAQELARLNEQVLRGYVLEHDVSAYQAHAHPDYKLVYAPGIIENLPMVLEGVELVDLTRFDIETLAADVVGDGALIITGIQAEGTVAGRPFHRASP